MLLDFLDSDADESVVIVLRQWLNQLQNYSSHRSLGIRPRQDYTHCVMLNDCISARWSPMCQSLALASFRDSHPLPTRHSRELVLNVLDTHRRLFFSLLQRFPLALCNSNSIVCAACLATLLQPTAHRTVQQLVLIHSRFMECSFHG